MNHGHDARHRRLAERLSYLRARIAYPERRDDGQRLAAIESDMLTVLEHLTGGCREEPERAESPSAL